MADRLLPAGESAVGGEQFSLCQPGNIVRSESDAVFIVDCGLECGPMRFGKKVPVAIQASAQAHQEHTLDCVTLPDLHLSQRRVQNDIVPDELLQDLNLIADLIGYLDC